MLGWAYILMVLVFQEIWNIIITPAHRVKGSILVSPYPSFCLSVCSSDLPSVERIVSPLYLLQYLPDPFHIYISHQTTSEIVSHVMIFFEITKCEVLANSLNLFWLGIQYELVNSMGNHGVAGVSSECRYYYIPRIRRIGGCYGFTSEAARRPPPAARRPQWC